MQANKYFKRLNVGPDTSVLLTKLSSISVSVLSFKFEVGSVQPQCTGDIPKSLINEEILIIDRPTNWSHAFSSWIYQYFIGLVLQPALRQIEAMGEETVQTVATMIISPFLIEWTPSIPFSTQSAWKWSKLSLMTLWNIFRNLSYWQLPGNSR